VITDDEIDKALDFLRDEAVNVAKARAERLYMEDFTRVLKAKLMGECNESAIGAQERFAYADPRYEAHLEATKTAVENDEKGRFLLRAAEAKIEAWRSFQANQRVMGKIV
jgi:hypothetical protein